MRESKIPVPLAAHRGRRPRIAVSRRRWCIAAQVIRSRRERKAMARAATRRKPTLFYATMHVTRAEQWCVEAETADEARALLAAGEGHRCDAGDCLHAELVRVEE